MGRTTRWTVLLAGLAALSCWLATACGQDSGVDSGGVDRGPPPAPEGIQIDRMRDGEFWLSWDPVPGYRADEIHYVVYRGKEADTPAAVDTTFSTEFRDVGLEYETHLTYFVIAVDANGNQSEPSALIQGQPLNSMAPMAPTGLRAMAHNLALYAEQSVAVSLDWDQNAESDLHHYRVYRGLEADFPVHRETLIAEVDVPRMVDSEVDVGVTYYYRVTAVDRGGKESPVSWQAQDTPLPQASLVEPVRGELVDAVPTFRWQAVPDAVIYQVIVTTSPGSGEISAMPLTRQTSATFRGRTMSDGRSYRLESGQVYYWKVIAGTRSSGEANSVSRAESFKVR